MSDAGIRSVFAKTRVYSIEHVSDLWSGVLSFNKKRMPDHRFAWTVEARLLMQPCVQKMSLLFPKTRFAFEKIISHTVIKTI